MYQVLLFKFRRHLCKGSMLIIISIISFTYGKNTISFEMHWTVLSVFNNKMEKKKVTHFRKSDLVQLLCTTSKNFFNSNCISFCSPDSFTFDSISSEDRETKHGKIINCKLFMTDTDV